MHPVSCVLTTPDSLCTRQNNDEITDTVFNLDEDYAQCMELEEMFLDNVEVRSEAVTMSDRAYRATAEPCVIMSCE